MIGGTGGQPFYGFSDKNSLQQIRIRAHDRVIGMKLSWEGGVGTSYVGGSGGTDNLFYLDKSEAIITVFVWTCSTSWASSVISAIQFQTTKGRMSEKYGAGTGSPTVLRGFDGKKERALSGFIGRFGTEMDAIEPVWSDTRDLGPLSISVGDAKGGQGGNFFDMLTTVGDPLKTALKAIYLRSAGRIDAIELKFQDDKNTGHKGGWGGADGEFVLGLDERVIRIQGRADNTIHQLQFFTNKRSSQIFGGNGGSPFLWTPPSTGTDAAADANMSLLCFQGRGGSEIDSLSPVWAIDPPVKFELNIESYDTPQAIGQGKLDAAWTSEKTTENRTEEPMSSRFNWKMEGAKSTTLSVSESSRTVIGGKLGMEVAVKGKAGIPFVAEGEVEAKVGIEVSAEHEWGRSLTDEKSVTKTFTETHEDIITIRARSRMKGSAVAYRVEVKNLRWSGSMLVTYAGGGRRTFPVSGTFDSATALKCHTTFVTEAL